MLPQKMRRKSKLLLLGRWGRSSSLRSRAVRQSTLLTIRQRQAQAERRAAVLKQKYPFTRSTATEDRKRHTNPLPIHSLEIKSETNSIEGVSQKQEQPSTKQKPSTIPQTSTIGMARPVRKNRSVNQYKDKYIDFVFANDKLYDYEEEERKGENLDSSESSTKALVLKPPQEKEQVACSSQELKAKAEEKAEVKEEVVNQETSNSFETFDEALDISVSEILMIIKNTDCRLDLKNICTKGEKKISTLESSTTVMDSIDEYEPEFSKAEIPIIPEEDLPNTKALFYRPEDYEDSEPNYEEHSSGEEYDPAKAKKKKIKNKTNGKRGRPRKVLVESNLGENDSTKERDPSPPILYKIDENMVEPTHLPSLLLPKLEEPIEEHFELNASENFSSSSSHTSSDTIDISTLRSSQNEIAILPLNQDTLNVSDLPLQTQISVIAGISRVTQRPRQVKKSVRNSLKYIAQQRVQNAEKDKIQTTMLDKKIIKDNDKVEEKMANSSNDSNENDSLDFEEILIAKSIFRIDLEDSESNVHKKEKADAEHGNHYPNFQSPGPCSREMEVEANQNEKEITEFSESFSKKNNANIPIEMGRLEGQENNDTGIELPKESKEIEFLQKNALPNALQRNNFEIKSSEEHHSDEEEEHNVKSHLYHLEEKENDVDQAPVVFVTQTPLKELAQDDNATLRSKLFQEGIANTQINKNLEEQTQKPFTKHQVNETLLQQIDKKQDENEIAETHQMDEGQKEIIIIDQNEKEVKEIDLSKKFQQNEEIVADHNEVISEKAKAHILFIKLGKFEGQEDNRQELICFEKEENFSSGVEFGPAKESETELTVTGDASEDTIPEAKDINRSPGEIVISEEIPEKLPNILFQDKYFQKHLQNLEEKDKSNDSTQITNAELIGEKETDKGQKIVRKREAGNELFTIRERLEGTGKKAFHAKIDHGESVSNTLENNLSEESITFSQEHLLNQRNEETTQVENVDYTNEITEQENIPIKKMLALLLLAKMVQKSYFQIHERKNSIPPHQMNMVQNQNGSEEQKLDENNTIEQEVDHLSDVIHENQIEKRLNDTHPHEIDKEHSATFEINEKIGHIETENAKKVDYEDNEVEQEIEEKILQEKVEELEEKVETVIEEKLEKVESKQRDKLEENAFSNKNDSTESSDVISEVNANIPSIKIRRLKEQEGTLLCLQKEENKISSHSREIGEIFITEESITETSSCLLNDKRMDTENESQLQVDEQKNKLPEMLNQQQRKSVIVRIEQNVEKRNKFPMKVQNEIDPTQHQEENTRKIEHLIVNQNNAREGSGNSEDISYTMNRQEEEAENSSENEESECEVVEEIELEETDYIEKEMETMFADDDFGKTFIGQEQKDEILKEPQRKIWQESVQENFESESLEEKQQNDIQEKIPEVDDCGAHVEVDYEECVPIEPEQEIEEKVIQENEEELEEKVIQENEEELEEKVIQENEEELEEKVIQENEDKLEEKVIQENEEKLQERLEQEIEEKIEEYIFSNAGDVLSSVKIQETRQSHASNQIPKKKFLGSVIDNYLEDMLKDENNVSNINTEEVGSNDRTLGICVSNESQASPCNESAEVGLPFVLSSVTCPFITLPKIDKYKSKNLKKYPWDLRGRKKQEKSQEKIKPEKKLPKSNQAQFIINLTANIRAGRIKATKAHYKSLFECDECSIYFKYPKYATTCLKEHQRKKCWICLKMISSKKDSFRIHNKKNHPGNNIKCPFCPSKLFFNIDLRRHIEREHANLSPAFCSEELLIRRGRPHKNKVENLSSNQKNTWTSIPPIINYYPATRVTRNSIAFTATSECPSSDESNNFVDTQIFDGPNEICESSVTIDRDASAPPLLPQVVPTINDTSTPSPVITMSEIANHELNISGQPIDLPRSTLRKENVPSINRDEMVSHIPPILRLSILPEGLNHLHLSKSFQNNTTKQGKRPSNDLKCYTAKIPRYSTNNNNQKIPIASTEEKTIDSTIFSLILPISLVLPKRHHTTQDALNKPKDVNLEKFQPLPLKPKIQNFPISEITQVPSKICELSPNLNLSPIDFSLSQNISHSNQVFPLQNQSPPKIQPVLGPQLRELLSETSSSPDMQTFTEGNRNAEFHNFPHQTPVSSSTLTQFPSNAYLLSVYPPPLPLCRNMGCQALVNNNNLIQVKPRDWLDNPLMYFQELILLPALLLPKHPKVKFERYAFTWLCLVWGLNDYNFPLTKYESEMVNILQRNYYNARNEVQLSYGEKIALFRILDNSSIMRQEYLSDIVIPLINLDYLPEEPPAEFSPIELFHLRNLKNCNSRCSTYDKRHKILETFVAKCRLNNNR